MIYLHEKMKNMNDDEIQEMRRSENDKCTMEFAGHKQAQLRLLDDNIYFNQKVTEFLESRKQRSAVQNQKPDYEKMWKELKIRLSKSYNFREHPVFHGWMKDLERIEESNAGVQSKK